MNMTSSSSQALAAPTDATAGGRVTPKAAAAAAAATADSGTSGAAAAATGSSSNDGSAAMTKNKFIASQYRSRRCPRWRLRQDPSARRRGALLYDGPGPPFEKATQTRDGIAVWTRATPGCGVKEVLAEISLHQTPRDKLWRAINDLERYGEFVPFVKKSEVRLHRR